MFKHPIPLIFVTLISIGLSGCQSGGAVDNVQHYKELVVDIGFSGHTIEPEAESEIFAIPDDVKLQLTNVGAEHIDTELKAKAVLEFILQFADDGLIYDNASTRTVRETLEYGRANCLSLSILAYSLATELGMDATFQDVKIPEYWTSNFNQSWLNGHVNVRISKKKLADINRSFTFKTRDVIVDFDPYSLKKHFPEFAINKQRIVAMFYNNKAAQAFTDGNYLTAFTYYKAAVNADPTFAVTWSNLAVLYRVHNQYQLAEQSYNLSLKLNPDSNNTRSNLAYLYRMTDRQNKAEILEQQIIEKRKNNPYYYLMLGNESLKNNDMEQAVMQFHHSLRLDKHIHEAHFGLAKAFFALHKPDKAAYYLDKAVQTATSSQDQRRYETKLNMLNQIAHVN